MMNVLTRRLLSSWWDFYQGAVGVWRGWARSRARADLIRICDRFNVSLRKSDWKATSEQVGDGYGESERTARTAQGSTIPRTLWELSNGSDWHCCRPCLCFFVPLFLFFFVSLLTNWCCPPKKADNREDPDRGDGGKNNQVRDHRAAEVRSSCCLDLKKSSFHDLIFFGLAPVVKLTTIARCVKGHNHARSICFIFIWIA